MFFELVKWLRGRGATPPLRAYFQNRPRLRSMYFLRRSEIRRALLSLLSSRPRHAYELMERLEGKEGGAAKSLYPALQRLCDEGLVKVDAHHSWRTYWLSAAGQAELQSGTASKLRNHSTTGRTRLPGYKAADLNAQVATFAAHVTKAALRIASLDSHAYGRILKVCQILARTKHEIERLERP